MGHNANIDDLYTKKISVESIDYTKSSNGQDGVIESICHKMGGYE
jgi:hypothetical protein